MSVKKWMVYLLIGGVLFSFALFLFPHMILIGLISPDFGLNLQSEFWGLLFTLIFFVGIIEIREWHEWRGLEKLVKNEIGRQMESLIDTFIVTFCMHPPRGITSRSEYEKYYSKPLIELKKNIWDDPDKLKLSSVGYALINAPKEFVPSSTHFYESISNFISTTEIKYWKFLNGEIQKSLKIIQGELRNLPHEFRGHPQTSKEREDKIETIMRKIIKEMNNLNNNGISISV